MHYEPLWGYVLQLIVLWIVVAVTTIGFHHLVYPFTSTVWKYRTDYRPKGVVSDAEGEGEEETRQRDEGRRRRWGYFGMLVRVGKTEGYLGYYKGFEYRAMASSISVAFYIFLLVYGNPISPKYISWAWLDAMIWANMIDLPFMTLAYRSVATTPNSLPTSPSSVVTLYERRRPYRLYLVPGLLLSQLGWCIVDSIKLHFIRTVDLYAQGSLNSYLFRRVGVMAVGAIFLCPLEVLVIRTAAQRLGEATPSPSPSPPAPSDSPLPIPQDAASVPAASPQALSESTPLLTTSSMSPVPQADSQLAAASEGTPEPEPLEPVVRLGPEGGYDGFFDAVFKIVKEEGIGALYRGWWITFMVSLAR